MGSSKLSNSTEAVGLILPRKSKGELVSERELIVYVHTHIYRLSASFCSFRNYHCMINVKITFLYGILKIIQLSISNASQILLKEVGELIF